MKTVSPIEKKIMKSMEKMTLKEMGIDVGKMARIKELANDLGIEVEEGETEYDIAHNMYTNINSKDDTEWDAMSADLREWSNSINTARRMFVEKAVAKATKEATKEIKDSEEKEESVKSKKGKSKKEEAEKSKADPKPKAEKSKADPKADAKLSIAELKERAKKAAAENPKKKQRISDNMYRVGTSAWHVSQVILEAGKEGISIEDGIKVFDKRAAKHKLECRNLSGWVSKIFNECVKIKGLAERKGDKFFATKKLIKAE
jgi:hypothetical protein